MARLRLGQCLLALGCHAEAEAVLREAVTTLTAALGKDDSRTAEAIDGLSSIARITPGSR